jgi:gp16 family phage-associated protein
MKTSDQVKAEFRKKGVTIDEWAKKHGFKTQAVYIVIAGKAKCYYGNAHKIAVALGLKDSDLTGI